MTESFGYYTLTKQEIKSGGIQTRAFRICGLCSRPISPSGGPGRGSVCLECGDALKAGQLRGAVVWEDESE